MSEKRRKWALRASTVAAVVGLGTAAVTAPAIAAAMAGSANAGVNKTVAITSVTTGVTMHEIDGIQTGIWLSGGSRTSQLANRHGTVYYGAAADTITSLRHNVYCPPGAVCG